MAVAIKNVRIDLRTKKKKKTLLEQAAELKHTSLSSYILASSLNKLGIKCGYIGTVGFYVKDKIRSLDNTTPNLYTLYSIFLECIEMGVEQVVLEVSSQAICGNRVKGLLFDYAIFTNLTEDHLDFHKTMENYALAKQQLFRQLKKDGKAIVNIDDDYKDYYLLKENHNITFGKKESDYQICDIQVILIQQEKNT